MEQYKVRGRIISALTGAQPAQAGFWVMLNLLDIVLSSMAIRTGSFEVNIVAQVLSMNSWGFFAYKLLMALVVPAILSCFGKAHALRYLNIGMAFVCLWNIVAISLGIFYL